MLRTQTLCSIIFIITSLTLVIYRFYFTEIKKLIAPTVGGREDNLKVIVAFGDSLTEGLFDWPNSRRFHPYTIKLQKLINDKIKRLNSQLTVVVKNFGISGERLRKSMRDRLHRVIALTNPDFVIILGGTNDLLDMEKEISANDFAVQANELIRDLKALHLYCHDKEIPTIALSIPETAIDDRDYNATVSLMRRIINKEMEDFANRSQTRTIFVDISTDTGRKHNRNYWDDGVHFTPMGYDRVAEIIFKEIGQVIKLWMEKLGSVTST